MTRDMRWPENIEIKVKQKVLKEISQFYENVGRKYKDSYGREEIKKLILENIKKPSKIDGTRMLSQPILEKWKDYGRVVIGRWYFAVLIKGNKVTIVDACHQQNMTNNRTVAELFEEDLNTFPSRITDIILPPPRGDRHFIRCKIDGEQQSMYEIPSRLFEKYKNGELNKSQLAEKCYAKELQEERFNIDEFLSRKRKL